MTYEFICNGCNVCFEKNLRIAERNSPQTCPSCASGDTRRAVSVPMFILNGDDFPSKNERVKKQKAENNKKLQKKQDEKLRDAPYVKLVPNVEGEQVESWSDAQKIAREQGKDASTYDSKVIQESQK